MSQAESSEKTPKGIQWGWIVAGLVIAAFIAGFAMKGMEGSIQYYMTVSEYFDQQSKYEGKKLKLAGKVKMGSLSHQGQTHLFVVEDLGKEVNVRFVGLTPDTFKEGSEVVVEGRGRLDENFEATHLMAKCASKYKSGGPAPFEEMRNQSVR